jgi:hypothetical protein
MNAGQLAVEDAARTERICGWRLHGKTEISSPQRHWCALGKGSVLDLFVGCDSLEGRCIGCYEVFCYMELDLLVAGGANGNFACSAYAFAIRHRRMQGQRVASWRDFNVGPGKRIPDGFVGRGEKIDSVPEPLALQPSRRGLKIHGQQARRTAGELRRRPGDAFESAVALREPTQREAEQNEDQEEAVETHRVES